MLSVRNQSAFWVVLKRSVVFLGPSRGSVKWQAATHGRITLPAQPCVILATAVDVNSSRYGAVTNAPPSQKTLILPVFSASKLTRTHTLWVILFLNSELKSRKPFHQLFCCVREYRTCKNKATQTRSYQKRLNFFHPSSKMDDNQKQIIVYLLFFPHDSTTPLIVES